MKKYMIPLYVLAAPFILIAVLCAIITAGITGRCEIQMVFWGKEE